MRSHWTHCFRSGPGLHGHVRWDASPVHVDQRLAVPEHRQPSPAPGRSPTNLENARTSGPNSTAADPPTPGGRVAGPEEKASLLTYPRYGRNPVRPRRVIRSLPFAQFAPPEPVRRGGPNSPPPGPHDAAGAIESPLPFGARISHLDRGPVSELGPGAAAPGGREHWLDRNVRVALCWNVQRLSVPIRRTVLRGYPRAVSRIANECAGSVVRVVLGGPILRPAAGGR